MKKKSTKSCFLVLKWVLIQKKVRKLKTEPKFLTKSRGKILIRKKVVKHQICLLEKLKREKMAGKEKVDSTENLLSNSKKECLV